MTATWTAPRTWSTGELVTASVMNTHVRDNLDWLKTPIDSGNITFAADFTTTSATYVDITGLTTTMTTNGGGLDVFLRLNCQVSAPASYVVQLLVDGVSTAVLGGSAGTDRMTHNFNHHIAAISAGSHTIKVQIKTAGGTATVKGTTSAVGDPLFLVVERGD